MKAIKLKDNIYWVGGIDWDIRDFHGYITQKGTTYNAYLIIDEKNVLIDTVKYHLYEEMLARISSVIDPEKIDTVISNHVEMDHSGGLPKILKLAKNAELITSFPSGEKGLRAHYQLGEKLRAVKASESINIGKRNLHFVPTPMIHWPDNMVTYCPEEKILFSNDSFGQHISSSERFDDEYPLDIIMEEAKKYYANIVLPYGKQVLNALKAIKSLDINIIAPSHGLIWRKNIGDLLKNYQSWAGNQTSQKAVIVYDTMWGSTKNIAYSIQEGFESNNIVTRLFNLKQTHISDIMTDIIDAKYICVGSPTLNNNLLPTTAAFLTYFKGLAPKERFGLAFGSYGWSGQSVGQVEDVLKSCGLELLEKIRINYIPQDQQLLEITEKIRASSELTHVK